MRKRDSENHATDEIEFDEDDDEEVEGLRVESAMTTKNRIIEASMKRSHELANTTDSSKLVSSDLMKSILDQDSLKALAANPELTNQLL